MTEQTILTAIKQIEPQIFWLFIKLVVASFLILLLKSWLENMVAYFRFTTNKFLGIGVRINVRGKNGKIAWYNTKWIMIKTDEGEIAILMKRWYFEQWTILNNEK